MKLISIHINSFGKLKDFEYKFDNLTQFCEENGYGKSTIVAFIKAMFYGLDSVRATSKGFLDRTHYYPFTKGTFGGNIIFENNNNIYRIERTFDSKSETKDTLVVYCNDSISSLGDIPGVTVFGINRDSFERLIMINSDKITISTDNDINQKLNNYVENIGEDFDFQLVEKQIKASKKTKTDLAKSNKEKIKELEDEIHNLEEIKESLDTKYNILNSLDLATKKAKELYLLASKEAAIIEKWNNYDTLVDRKLKLENDIKIITDQYPMGLPKLDEINTIKESLDELKLINNSLSNEVLSHEQRTDLDYLNNKYKEYPNDLNLIEEKINKYNDIEKNINNISIYEKSDKEKELEKHFFGDIISKEELDSINNEVTNYNTLEEELKAIKPTIITTKAEANNKKPNKLFPILLTLGMLLIVSGIALIFVLLPLGIILMTLGLVLLFVAIFIYFNQSIKSIKSNEISIEESNPEYIKTESELNNLYTKAINHFAKYRYEGNSLDLLLFQLNNDYNEYNKIIKDKENNNQILIELKLEQSKLKNELDNYFIKYSLNNLDYKKAIDIIKNDLVRLNTLSQTNKKYEETISLNNEKKKKIEENINDFYSKYQLSKYILIDKISHDLSEFNRLNKEYTSQQELIEEFKQNNKLEIRPQKEYDIDYLLNDMQNKLSEYNDLKISINGLEDEIAPIDDLKLLKERLIEERDLALNEVKLLDLLKDELNKADQELKDKYVAPIKNKFSYYASMLERSIGEKVAMDKDYRIYFDIEGALRSSEHLSSGNLALCALAFRLAILDNMFESELPFLILDDPFLSLDSTHLTKAKALIEELAKNKQIIYFTCHESRKL